MRTPHAGRTRLAALTAAAALLIGGCTGGSDGPDDPDDDTSASATTETESETESAEAASAARGYARELGTWSRRVSSVAERPVVRDGGFPKWPSLRPLLDAAPRLEPVEAPDGGTYERAAATAERVDAVVAELRAYEPFDYATDDLPGEVYDAYYAYYRRWLRIDDRYFEERLDTIDPDVPPATVDRRLAAQYADYARDLVRSDRRYAAEVRRLDAPGELRRSAIAHVLAEIDWLRDFHEEWRRECRAQEAAAFQAYKDLAFTATVAFDDVARAPYRSRGALTRSWARAVARLGRLATGTGPLPAGAPLVGDAYREQVVAQVARASGTTEVSRRQLAAQLWMLWRLRELEDTPEAGYDEARSTLVLLPGADARSGYEQVFVTTDQLRSPTTRPSIEGVVRQLDQFLAAPVPPVLEEAWQAAGAEVQAFELRPGDLLDRIRQARQLRQAVLRALIPAADALDSARRMTNAVEDVLAAARPT